MSCQYKEFAKLDGLQRINYLYQAAHMALLRGRGGVSLARFYTQTLDAVAKKSVIRLDASIKRSLCKSCHCPLVAGVTSTVRIQRKRRRSHQVVTCLECHSIKRFPVDADHQLWSENPEAWLGTVPAGKTHSEAGLGTVPAVKARSKAGVSTVPAQQTRSGVGLGTVPIGKIHSEAKLEALDSVPVAVACSEVELGALPATILLVEEFVSDPTDFNNKEMKYGTLPHQDQGPHS